MKKELFDKWIKVLTEKEKGLKKDLKEKKITSNIYKLLNEINGKKYKQIIRQYHQELV